MTPYFLLLVRQPGADTYRNVAGSPTRLAMIDAAYGAIQGGAACAMVARVETLISVGETGRVECVETESERV